MSFTGTKAELARDYLQRFPNFTVPDLIHKIEIEKDVVVHPSIVYDQRKKLGTQESAKAGYKSSIIREYLEKNPHERPIDLVKMIKKEKKVTVSAAQISGIKSQLNRGKPDISTNGIVPPAVDNLTKVYSLVNEIGSIEEAQTLLDTLKSLQLKGNG